MTPVQLTAPGVPAQLRSHDARTQIEREIGKDTWAQLGVSGRSAVHLMFMMIPDVEICDFRLVPMYDQGEVACLISLIVTEHHVYYTRIHKGTLEFRTIPIERFNVTVKVDYADQKRDHVMLICDVGDQRDDGSPNLHPIELDAKHIARVASVMARINWLREKRHEKENTY